MKSLGIYIHIPFCIKKCSYCDFLSFEHTEKGIHSRYIDALINELRHYSCLLGSRFIVDTVFIGGGTPSLIDAAFIENVLDCLKNNFRMAQGAEITIECNPGTLSPHKLESYRKAGINRVSMGVQALEDSILKSLGRAHSAPDARSQFSLARQEGFSNINLDFMFAVPGHTLRAWQETLGQAVDLEPEHISFYSLQLEEGTKLFQLFEQGKVSMVSDEDDRAMYHDAVRRLAGAGYRHYEISNCAKEGFECRHNLKYWELGDYLGLGLGSHSYLEGERFSNVRSLKQYIDALESWGQGRSPIGGSRDVMAERGAGCGSAGAQEGQPGDAANGTRGATEGLPAPWIEWRHRNSEFDNISEFMITGLRKTEGISLNEFEARFGKPFAVAYGGQQPFIKESIEKGYLQLKGGRLSFTLEGIDISNRILAQFV